MKISVVITVITCSAAINIPITLIFTEAIIVTSVAICIKCKKKHVLDQYNGLQPVALPLAASVNTHDHSIGFSTTLTFLPQLINKEEIIILATKQHIIVFIISNFISR